MKPPILFINFNRPEMTQRSLNCIKQYQPDRLYVFCDGPRENQQGEWQDEDVQVAQVRELLSSIGQPTKVFRLYNGANQGCRKAVQQALSWFFTYEKMGVILEDDCLASPAFFSYAERLLETYEQNPQVAAISGCNLNYKNTKHKNLDYRFTRFLNMWGWATWRRTYESIDTEMATWKSLQDKYTVVENWLSQDGRASDTEWVGFWVYQFDQLAQGHIDTWDYQWIYSILKQNQVCISPTINLVDNIGWGSQNATHTKISNPYLEIQSRPTYAALSKEVFNLQKKHLKINQGYEAYIKEAWCRLKFLKQNAH